MADIIVQPKVKNDEGGYDNLIINNANNTNKVQDIDLSSSDKAVFGDYIVPKLKEISNNNQDLPVILPIDATYRTIYSGDLLTNKQILIGVTLSSKVGLDTTVPYRLQKIFGPYSFDSNVIGFKFLITEPIFAAASAGDAPIEGYIQFYIERTTIKARIMGTSLSNTVLQENPPTCDIIYELII